MSWWLLGFSKRSFTASRTMCFCTVSTLKHRPWRFTELAKSGCISTRMSLQNSFGVCWLFKLPVSWNSTSGWRSGRCTTYLRLRFLSSLRLSLGCGFRCFHFTWGEKSFWVLFLHAELWLHFSFSGSSVSSTCSSGWSLLSQSGFCCTGWIGSVIWRTRFQRICKARKSLKRMKWKTMRKT